jgi:IS1 family transposase
MVLSAWCQRMCLPYRADSTTFTRLLNRLMRWGMRLFCTDHYIVYESRLVVGIHYQEGPDRAR